MSSEDRRQLNDRQRAFVHWYIQTKNATRSAQRAGYTGNDVTLASMGYELLRNPQIRGEIDSILRARLPSAHDILDLMAVRATMDVTAYARADGTIDIERMGKDGLGHLVKGIKPGREGTEITLVDPQKATQNLARYHRLLGADTQVDINTTLSANEDTLAALAQQIAAAQQSTAQQDDAEDSAAD